MNIRNYGIAIGRLTRDPKVFTNKDGSKKVMVTLACTDNFRSGPDKTKATQFIPLEGFVSKTANGLGVYAHMAKGDLVGMEYAVRTNAFKNAQGEDEYRTVLAVQSVELMESKSVTAARHSGAAGEAPAAAPEQAEGVADGDMDAPFGE